ncbi:bifunctional DNA primase/polymerase [Streptomyces halobius]|uniref:DUF3987 domain-containing protein n=1 Tax=Streptomyces halobius TaxID=2879846 RepID=A0ABY4M8H5_9ACTN|nr:bifunctional DNA primase/polymerase [Streptomyces halobius]UQA92671.1 DUF3987 domain-containing protein [Streptomyces halobius]
MTNERSRPGEGGSEEAAAAASPMSIAEAAVVAQATAWHAAGASVLPVRVDGTKRPAVNAWKQYQNQRMPLLPLRKHFADNPQLGVGVVCGQVSDNLEMLEFEGRAVTEGIYGEFIEIARNSGLGDVLDRIECSYLEQTPSGGFHLFYRVTGEPVGGNTKLASRPATDDELAHDPTDKIKVLIETRGEGGFVIVAPSHGPVHPTGKPWWLVTGGPDQLATITADERDALFTVARVLDQMPAKAEAPPPTQSISAADDGRLKPGDDYEQRHTWADILEPQGWEQVYTQGSTVHWRRPGKRLGTSATTGRNTDRDRLYVFTTSTEFDADPKKNPYTKFAAYAVLHHGGDYRAAAKALADQGYGDREPRGDVAHGLISGTVFGDDTDSPPPTPSAGLNLPEEFWHRAELKLIRQAAHARACSADAVLGAVLARMAGMVDHTVRADAGLGDASLNLFTVLAGPSAAGKSQAHECATHVFPPPLFSDFRDGSPLGSGEGLAELYMGWAEVTEPDKDGKPKTVKVRAQVRHNATIYADEGEAMTKMWERNGATVGETLRRAWTGQTLGQSNGNRDTTRIVKRGSYALGMVVGFQPETARPLLADAAAGTPQRFLWLWATDPTIPDSVDWPPHLHLPELPYGPLSIAFPQNVRDEIRRHKLAVGRGEVVPPVLDGHGHLMRMKVAALLALLGGRRSVTDGDWALSGLVWTTSCAVRDHLIARGRLQQERERELKKLHYGDREVYVDGRKHEAAVIRAAKVIHRAVYRADGKRMPRGKTRTALASRDRHLRDEALEYAIAQGWLIQPDDEHVELGRNTP